MTLAGRVIEGMERLTVTQGAGAGGPLVLLPWQKRFIRGALRDGVSTSALSVARGNGKTTLAAALAIAFLAGPVRRPRGEVLLVASSFQQATVAFGHVMAFMWEEMQADPKRWRTQNSQNSALIEDRETGSRLRAIGSDPRRAHGLAPIAIIADEPAQWPSNTSNQMLAALMTGLGKHDQGLLLALGTLPADEHHWFRRMFGPDGCDYAQLHAAPPDRPPAAAAVWRVANPSLPAMPALRKQIAREAHAAKQDPGLLASFRALRCNLGEHDTERAMLIDADLWERHEVDDPPHTYAAATWGIDLGGTAAFSAIASYDTMTGGLRAVAMVGGDPTPEERGLRDGVGRLYRQLADEGDLVVVPGRTVAVPDLVTEALNRFGRPLALAADRWREGELRDGLQSAGFPPAALQLRGMGFKDGGEDVRTFRRGVAEGRVKPRRSLLLRSAMAEAVTLTDPAGNSKLAKGHEAGRRVRARDDVAAAAILAVSLGLRMPAPKRGGMYRGTA